MPQSMTGFSAADRTVAPLRLVWEVRSVNHRFLELGFRMPDELRAVEPACRDLVAASVKRGKVDCTLKVTTAESAAVGAEIVPQTLAALRAWQAEVRAVLPDSQPLTVGEVLRWPGLIKEPERPATALADPAMECLAAALEGLQEARAREGARIGELLAQRAVGIAAIVADVRPLLAAAQVRHRDKLTERLARLDVQANPERLEQELAIVVQRLDVAEEIDRLDGHLTEIRDVLARDEPVGRRLDFLMQELNREANTFASKVQDAELTRAAVEMKVLIEQMREQVQNVE
jgi:uncharacterized protein (TIGR00255 family)